MVFLDLQLPDQDGLKLLEKLHKIDDTVPVVAISSMRSQQFAAKARDLGAFAYLEKPVSLSRIREILIQFQQYQD